MKKKEHKAGGSVNIAILNTMDAEELQDFFAFMMDSLEKLKEEEEADASDPDEDEPAADETEDTEEVGDAVETEGHDSDDSGVNDNADRCVAVIVPGENPRLEKYGDCGELLDTFGGFAEVWQIPGMDSFGAIYDIRRVLDFGGEKYLLGPVVAFRGNENFSAVREMDLDDYMKLRSVLENRTVTLEADQRELRVIRM